MSLKFFADHCIPNSLIESLTSDNYQVFRLREHLPTNARDIEVIKKANEMAAILISLNSDFADIITYPPSEYLGIIALQFQDQPKLQSHVLSRLKTYFKKNPEMQHYQGKLFVAEPHRIRVWE